MNLARVEYYFSDLSSVLESGRDAQGRTQEGIFGTVNADETTYASSPKVLDRAFTLELGDVDFAN